MVVDELPEPVRPAWGKDEKAAIPDRWSGYLQFVMLSVKKA